MGDNERVKLVFSSVFFQTLYILYNISEKKELILPLEYMADIVIYLKKLNTSIQWTRMTMIIAREKLLAFTKNI